MLNKETLSNCKDEGNGRQEPGYSYETIFTRNLGVISNLFLTVILNIFSIENTNSKRLINVIFFLLVDQFIYRKRWST